MGLEETDYPVYKVLNQSVIKPAIKEINALTDYHVEVEQKRFRRRIAELKFRITRVKALPVQESVFPDIENLAPVAVELIQAEIDRKMALEIAKQDWDFVTPEKLPAPGSYADFLGYVAEKIEMSLDAAVVKNRAGYIVEAIRENYQDAEVQKARQLRAEKVREKELQELTEEFKIKQQNILRQAVHADPNVGGTRRQTHPFLHRPGTASRTRLGIGSVSERRDGDCRDQRYPCGRVLSGFVGTGC